MVINNKRLKPVSVSVEGATDLWSEEREVKCIFLLQTQIKRWMLTPSAFVGICAIPFVCIMMRSQCNLFVYDQGK